MTTTATAHDVREIPSVPGYAATAAGEIINLRTGHTMKARACKRHLYLFVKPIVDGKQQKRAVHRLVAEAFYGRRPAGMETRHLNGIKEDCSAANLCYGTPRQNHEDCVRHGRSISLLRGEAHPAHRLKEETVEDVLLFVGFGDSQASVGKRFGLSQRMVHNIVVGRNWGHVARSPTMRAKVTVAA